MKRFPHIISADFYQTFWTSIASCNFPQQKKQQQKKKKWKKEKKWWLLHNTASHKQLKQHSVSMKMAGPEMP